METKIFNNNISQLLSFYLNATLEAMLPTKQLREIVNLAPSQVVPIFGMLPAIMGIYNRRGEVLWLVDLACLLGLEPLYSQNYHAVYRVIVFQQESYVVGFVVSQVGHLVLCSESQIQPLTISDLPSQLISCLQGEKKCLNGNNLLLLDGLKIIKLLNQ
jgi:positive phototaxis protein PixI